MGNIGDSFLTGLPAVGTGGPTYAVDYNAIMTEVMTRLSTKIPFSSLSLTSSFDLNGQAILNSAYVQLLNTASSPGASPVNRITAFAGNLYWVGPSGAVQITVGTLLNAAAIGGITGDYGGANPAQFRYDAANTRYEAYHNFATGTWAHIRSRGLDISAAATGTNMAQLRYGGAGTLTFTLPPTLPASNAILGISSGGAITSNPSIGTDITLSGATVIKHGDRVRGDHPRLTFTTTGTVSSSITNNQVVQTTSVGGDNSWVVDGFDVGERVKSIELSHNLTAPSTATVYVSSTTGTAVSVPVTITTPAGGRYLLTFNTPVTVATSGTTFHIRFTTAAATALIQFLSTYDRP